MICHPHILISCCQYFPPMNGSMTKSEELRATRLQPERNRWLVDRNKTGRVEGVEKEVVPAIQHARNPGGVILGPESATAEIPRPPSPGPLFPGPPGTSPSAPDPQPQRWAIDAAQLGRGTATVAHRCGSSNIDDPSLRLPASARTASMAHRCGSPSQNVRFAGAVGQPAAAPCGPVP